MEKKKKSLYRFSISLVVGSLPRLCVSFPFFVCRLGISVAVEASSSSEAAKEEEVAELIVSQGLVRSSTEKYGGGISMEAYTIGLGIARDELKRKLHK